MKARLNAMVFAALLSGALVGCDDAGTADEHDDHDDHDEDGDHDDHDHDHDNELITTVTLTFTSSSGDVVTASFRDEDGEGGASGTTDELRLAPETTYAVRLELLNELEDEDVTEEIAEEAEGHFVFFYGPNVSGPSSAGDGFLVHEFDDVESDYTENKVGEDLPVGLASIITTSDAGSGRFSVLVRHLPDVNDTPQKSGDQPEAFARGEDIAGNNDVDVAFEVTVE